MTASYRYDVEILHLLVSPAHAYFGRARDGAADVPTTDADRVELVAGKGIVGDRFFGKAAHMDAAVTLIAAEALEEMAAELGAKPFDPLLARRNVVLRGAQLAPLIGADFVLESGGTLVRLRAGRTDALVDDLFLAAETDLGAVVGQVDAVEPSFLVIDSVQTMAHPEVDGAPGGVTQVREVTGALVRLAKERHIAVVLVGHVTKEGAIAGPRMLEHLVDVVLAFDGDRHSGFRMVRATKNRFGPSDEVGCFDMVDTGIVEVTDPTGLFVSEHAEPVAGTCVTVMMEGRRPLLAEVQALVGPSAAPQPRRTTSGLESSRVAMVLAVLGNRAGLKLADQEVYVATVGGVKITEPVADLSVAIAVASSVMDKPIHPGLVAIGEVGLAGEVRRVGGLEKRLAEAARLGFTKAIVPADIPNRSKDVKPMDIQKKYGLRTFAAPDIRSALMAAGLA